MLFGRVSLEQCVANSLESYSVASSSECMRSIRAGCLQWWSQISWRKLWWCLTLKLWTVSRYTNETCVLSNSQYWKFKRDFPTDKGPVMVLDLVILHSLYSLTWPRLMKSASRSSLFFYLFILGIAVTSMKKNFTHQSPQFSSS